MLRIDTHLHAIPPVYREALKKAGITEAGGRAMPEWSVESAQATMAELGIGTAVLSVSAPGTTFLQNGADAAALARDVNDGSAALRDQHPERFGFFATVPLPHLDRGTDEAVRALDELHADGVVLLANSNGVYLGEPGQDSFWAELDRRSAVVFIHPNELPGPAVDGIPPFAADFLLDTTRAAYLLVRNEIRSHYPNIRFILSHAGGFVPYASYRMAVSIMSDTGRSPIDLLAEFSSFYFDTALSSSAAALPSLLAFADPGHIFFGSDWPFAPLAAGQFFAAGLQDYPGLDQAGRDAIDRNNALALFPRLGTGPSAAPVQVGLPERVRGEIRRRAIRLMAGAVSKAR